MATLGGSLHGRAGRWCGRLLDRTVASSGAHALDEAERRWGRVPGFGHPLYPDGDPRASRLLGMIDHVWRGSRHLDVVHATVAAGRRRDLEPNVELPLRFRPRVELRPTT